MPHRAVEDIEQELKESHLKFYKILAVVFGFMVLLNITSNLIGWVSLDKIREATSPAAQARQAEVVDALVVRIECSNRRALQDAFQELVDEGLFEEGAIEIVSDACFPFDDGRSTTTNP